MRIRPAGFEGLIEDGVDQHGKADHFAWNIFDHALDVIVAGHGSGQLHSGDIGLQHAFKTRDLQIEVGYPWFAHQSAH